MENSFTRFTTPVRIKRHTDDSSQMANKIHVLQKGKFVASKLERRTFSRSFSLPSPIAAHFPVYFKPLRFARWWHRWLGQGVVKLVHACPSCCCNSGFSVDDLRSLQVPLQSAHYRVSLQVALQSAHYPVSLQVALQSEHYRVGVPAVLPVVQNILHFAYQFKTRSIPPTPWPARPPRPGTARPGPERPGLVAISWERKFTQKPLYSQKNESCQACQIQYSCILKMAESLMGVVVYYFSLLNINSETSDPTARLTMKSFAYH